MNSALGWFVVAFLLVQAPVAPPARIGVLAASITQREVTEILELPGAGNPWLLHVRHLQIGGFFAEIFLSPTTTAGNLRRGTMLAARRWTLAAADPSAQKWQIAETAGTYAQVGVEGQKMDTVVSHLDISRPFAVSGAFTDGELLEIVGLIRSNPQAAASNFIGRPATVLGASRPIRSIRRESADAVIVEVYIDESRGQKVTLRKQDSGWVAVSAMEWIA